MENKYYVPDISEFHVGFEYEWLCTAGNKWLKKVYKEGIFLEESLENCRVKYLDKEDIESLGFEEIGQEDYYLNGDLDNWRIERLYDKDKNYFYRIEKEDRGDIEQIFFVYIKNKSELKKLLKQLGINRK